MGYTNPEFLARFPFVAGFAKSLSTSTASGANTIADVVTTLPKFFRRTKLQKVRFICTTIPNAGSTALVAQVKNGTNVAATVTLTTATAGQQLNGVVNDANAIFAADSAPTISVVGTATASGSANGAYDVVFELREEYV